MGEAPESTVLVQDVAEAEALVLPPDTRVAYITQTTLSVDETLRSSASSAGASPNPRAEEGGHLLRDLQPQWAAEMWPRSIRCSDRPATRRTNCLADVARAGMRRT
jgi:hypothetical protein